MRTRILARAATVAAAVVVPLLVGAAPALASIKPDDGEVPGRPLGIGLTIVEFVLIPLGAFILIAGLSLLPSALNRPRYRPGKAWDHDPLWFGGPGDPEQALDAARPGVTSRGGVSAEW